MNLSKVFLTAFFGALLSITICAQTPTPPDAGDVVKISTNLIQIDVTVTDKKGNVVTDLKPGDFEIFENGKKQDITNLSYIPLISEAPQSETKQPDLNTKNKKIIPDPSIKLKPEQVRRTYALVVDDLGLSFANAYWTKQALQNFIKEQVQEGDLVAILRVGGGLGSLQAFTSDKRQLLAAVDKIRWNPQGRVGVDSFPAITQSLKDNLEGTIDRAGNQRNVQGDLFDKGNEIKNDSDRQTNFAIGTIGALNYVVRGMNSLPGRKSLIIFSEGFNTFDYSRVARGDTKFPENTYVFDRMKMLTELANRSAVTIYTIDPRGVVAPGDPTAADDITPNSRGVVLETNGRSLREQQYVESKQSLQFLSDETGGFSFFLNNIDSGIKKILNDQKGYYLIGYQPDSETFDPSKNKFNKLSVKINRPDLKVRYRSGFFGITDEKYKPAQSTQSDLIAALTSPFGINGININLYSAFYNNERNENLIRSFVYINPKDLSFTLGSDGLYHAKFDIIATIFDADGTAASNDVNSHSLQFTKERYAVIQEKGIVYDLPIPISKTGAYQFRVALKDSATGKIGAASQFIEIPNLGKKRLALSNLIVRNYTLDEWKKRSSESNDFLKNNTTLLDSVTRQFKKGSMLTYFFEIYNAKTAPNKSPQLLMQTRLFRDGKIFLESNPAAINTDQQNNLDHIGNLKVITLGTDLQPGDYALQVIVYDKQAKEKNQVAAQSIDFEITE
jgi:VWFA-related protein